MIDWWGAFYNSLWVVGLAICLGMLGVANYEAQRAKVRLRWKWKETGFQLAFSVGVALFCLGLLFSSRAWWEYASWGLLAVISIGQAVRLWWHGRAAREVSNGHNHR